MEGRSRLGQASREVEGPPRTGSRFIESERGCRPGLFLSLSILNRKNSHHGYGMNILLLAPHPFYQERGTPIAVHLLLNVLAKRDTHVRVITYHEGEEKTYPKVQIQRIPRLPLIRDIGPGFSFKKIICDVYMFFSVWRAVVAKRPHVIHAVEESVFMAMIFRLFFRIPYVYDMDSSMAQQLVEGHPGLSIFSRILNWFEGRAIKKAVAVVPVCPALAELAQKHRPAKLVLLSDISLLFDAPSRPAPGLRQELDIPSSSTCFMYIGNLERYQGIDLLLESFALARQAIEDISLVIVGGTPGKITMYREKAAALDIADKVHFTGPKDSAMMGSLFQEADVLVSPRCKGLNTPMKIYSYLDSGRAILATDLPTHSQVLSPEVALLAPAQAVAFSQAIRHLAQTPDERERLAKCAGQLARKHYSIEAFSDTVNDLYDFLERACPNRR
jgi:glycosyltransferase involved in cell wall biosynthesis